VRDLVTSAVGGPIDPEFDAEINKALAERNPKASYSFVVNTTPELLMFAMDGGQYEQGFKIGDGAITLEGEPKRVRSITDYVRVITEAKMNKQQMIDRIVAGRKFKDAEGEKSLRVALDKSGEETLRILAETSPIEPSDEDKAKAEAEAKAKAEAERVKAEAEADKQKAAKNPELSPATVKFLTDRLERMRTQHVTAIKAATKVYSDDDLKEMSFDILEKTAEAFAPAETSDYSGRGGPRTASEKSVDPLEGEVEKYDERVRVLREGRGKAA
jgi:hypothetical protein